MRLSCNVVHLQAHRNFHTERGHVLFMDTVATELPGNADFVAAMDRARLGWRCARPDCRRYVYCLSNLVLPRNKRRFLSRTWLQALTDAPAEWCGVSGYATECNRCTQTRASRPKTWARARLNAPNAETPAHVLGLGV